MEEVIVFGLCIIAFIALVAYLRYITKSPVHGKPWNPDD